ncbi:MAG: cysteine peptidase family C39 domain-containing protein [Kiritimatiellia bacterium]
MLILSHFVLGGCATSVPKTDNGTQALPLAPQSTAQYQCGPSTLASVLAFHGKPVPEHVIAAAIYSPTAQGVLLSDMAWYARQQGFHADLRTGSVDDLKQSVAQRLPPIVLLDYGIGHVRRPHFTAITGVLEGGIFQLNDKRADDYVRMKRFRRLWKRAGNQYMVITPVASR